ncbi:MAG: hypothetical protein HRU15_08320, partial [Planctomycetes bacterium]|nr:hypothetical protein [Planctomycetota bacterium]
MATLSMKKRLIYSTRIIIIILLTVRIQSVFAEDEHPLVLLMKAMPEVDIGAAEKVTAIQDTQLIMPGLRVEAQKRIYLDATVLFSQGPQDGLEAIACMRGGKNHESMLLLECANGELIKSMFIAHLHLLEDGQSAREESGVPARGFPLRVLMRWRPDPVLEPDNWVQRDISTMVRDRSTSRALPAVPYVYVGSRFQVIQNQKKFMLNVTKTLITNYDEPDTLLASPFPLAMFDYLFEVNSADMPEEDSKVQIIFERALLPLQLHMDETGALHYAGTALDDRALQGLLLRF